MSPSRKTTSQEKFWKVILETIISVEITTTLSFLKISLFAKILNETSNVKSVIEYGPNIGFNIRAYNNCYQAQNLQVLKSIKKLVQIYTNQNNHVENCSILDFRSKKLFDLSLVMTLLIHINPKT